MKWHLQCAAQPVSSSNITEYCACHAKWLSLLLLVTYETLFTMRGTTDGILQHHRILRLPPKMTVMTDPRHIWNVVYNAQSNMCHSPNSPNTAPATKNDCHDLDPMRVCLFMPDNHIHRNYYKVFENYYFFLETVRDFYGDFLMFYKKTFENICNLKDDIPYPYQHWNQLSRLYCRPVKRCCYIHQGQGWQDKITKVKK